MILKFKLTISKCIVPNMNALESTIHELEASRYEIQHSLEEVNDSISELELNINRVFEEQNDKLNPEIIETLNGQCSK